MRRQSPDGKPAAANHSLRGKNGSVETGSVSLESIAEAPEKGYTYTIWPFHLGSVYIVKTRDRQYAKFVVTKIEEDTDSPAGSAVGLEGKAR